jgi:hypothetical protein
MWSVVHTIEKEFGAEFMRETRGSGNVDNRTEGVGSYRAGHEPSPPGKQGLQILDVETSIVSHAPPGKPGACGGQRKPSGDVGFVIHIRQDDLVPVHQSLANGQTHQADERGSVHAEGDFAGIAGVQQDRNALSCFSNCAIHLFALLVPATALNIAIQQVVVHGIKNALGNLGARRVVKIDEPGLLQSGESRAYLIDGELPARRFCLVSNRHPMSFLCELAAPSVKRTAVAAAKLQRSTSSSGGAAEPGRLYVKHICFVYSLHTFDSKLW